MNKLTIALLFILQVTCLESFGQVPGITYQAVILSPEGKGLPGVNHTNIPLATQEICLRFSFLNQDGEKEYEETIQTKTDPLGMVNVIIGKGNQVGGSAASFDKIPWSIATKFLEVSLDKSGTCTEFSLISKQEFTAVPFALFSVNSGATDSEITQGKSAYQIWIDLGNIGTEQDFLKSLKGPTGPQGPIGATGAAGQTGATGPVGAAGTNGLSAYQVWLGLGNTGTEANFIASLTGPSGPQGPAGVAGVVGPQGVAGVAGPQGAIGPVGPQGPAGADGVAASAATFVDLSTNQSIGGTKTFNNPIAGSITGNAATVTTNANLTGEVTSTGNTATLSNSAVIGQVLTGFSSGAGTVSATDNILQAVQKVDGNVSTANASVAGKQNLLTNSAGLSGALSDETGTGLAVFNTSPTLVTPNLGTPSALVGTNITGTAAGLTAGRVTTNADLTGVVTSSGNVTVIANGVITNAMLANGAVANLSGTNTGDQTATTVSNTSAGTIAATTVQGALNELDTEKAPLASPTFTGTVTIPTLVAGTNTFPTSSGNNNQVLSTNGSGTLTWTTPSASLVSNSAAGTIAATDVQTALNELDTEKAPLASPTFTGSLKVNGAASNSQAKVYAASETSLDFSLSNLISTNASAGAFTLLNMRDGSTYTLAVTGGSVGTASFTHSGLTFNSLYNSATTSGKTALYTFIVMGTQVYFSMASVE